VINRLVKPKDLAKARCHSALHQETTAPAIADYALIGDCRTGALVSRDGSIDWLCLPNFSSPSVFARLLDPRGGSFSLHPTQPFASTRRYVEGTAVLETTFETEGGSARIFDCLAAVDGIAQIRPLREVLRIVEGVRRTAGCQLLQNFFEIVHSSNSPPPSLDQQVHGIRTWHGDTAAHAIILPIKKCGGVRPRIVFGLANLAITPLPPPAPRCASFESPASGTGPAQSISQGRRSGRSEHKQDYRSP
jgi:hypothetical protein